MRTSRILAIAIAGAIGVVGTSCYQPLDFGIDHKADHVYVDADGDWWNAETGTMIRAGDPSDLAVPADWDGNHFWDMAVVTADGDWLTGTSRGTIHYPKPAQLPGPVPTQATILPVAGDYDGDGLVEPAWYRDTDGTWFIAGRDPVVFGSGPSGGLHATTSWSGGPASSIDQDYAVPADYDGDGITDLSTFNPRSMAWKVRSSIDGSVSTVVMTGNAYLPMPAPADYDGVGHAQRALAGSDGWYIEGHADHIAFGQYPDVSGFPAVADYDGDGRADPSFVAYPIGASTWHTLGSDDVYPIAGELAESWPVGSTNLLYNIARFTYIGRCSVPSPTVDCS